MEAVSEKMVVTPGLRICKAGTNYVAAEGTYLLNKYIYASTCGVATIIEKDNRTFVKVALGSHGTVIPEIGSVVTCRVLSVTPMQAVVSIICKGPVILDAPFMGSIRKHNVRDHQIDTVEMYNCFRPQDIVLARVISLGDARMYELSTAGNELGVVTATCLEGHPLVPASWTHMRCQCKVEQRKVAKVMPPRNVSL